MPCRRPPLATHNLSRLFFSLPFSCQEQKPLPPSPAFLYISHFSSSRVACIERRKEGKEKCLHLLNEKRENLWQQHRGVLCVVRMPRRRRRQLGWRKRQQNVNKEAALFQLFVHLIRIVTSSSGRRFWHPKEGGSSFLAFKVALLSTTAQKSMTQQKGKFRGIQIGINPWHSHTLAQSQGKAAWTFFKKKTQTSIFRLDDRIETGT